MTSPPALALEDLLQPIPGAAPCGADLSFSEAFDQIARARREDDASLDQGEWVTPLKAADWPEVVRHCSALLQHQTQASVVLAAHPDAQITIDTTTNNGELPEQLSARLANSGIEREASFAQVKKLFDERRTVNGMTGHAAGYKVPTTASILAHRLAFQVLGSAAPNTLQPEITLLLKSGEQRDDASYPAPSVSDEEARALFDRLVSSLRLRPSRS